LLQEGYWQAPLASQLVATQLLVALFWQGAVQQLLPRQAPETQASFPLQVLPAPCC
jgi:hypothetical protein